MEGSIRIGTDTLTEKRAAKRARILITGATGFIGSHIASELLKQGYSLTTIARPQGRLSARGRVEQILAWLGVDPTDFTKIQVLEGYLDRPGLGLSKPLYEDLVANLDEIIHCASSTSFTERKRKEVEAANIQGLQNILELAVGGHCYFWHHMSTAYVAGKREGLCREEIAETARYTNVYEETKYWGERMVADFCTRHGIRFNIFRPSIVYGHSGNGRSSIFRGLYYPVRVVAYLKSLYEADIRENGGQRAAAMGVRSTADGSIYLPLRLEVNENGGINLIPIDYLVRAFVAIMEESLEGGIFHMVSPNP